MKKLLIAFAVATMAVASYAQAVNWDLMSYDDIMCPDNTTAYNGTMTLACSALSWSMDVTVTDGQFYEAAVVIDVPTTGLGQDYDFTITGSYTDGAGKAWTYAGTGFGSTDTFGGDTMAGFDAGTWTAVPEPTSGLLLLLGVAGLALKRKRA